MKKRILIKTYGFIGDILFASSIAKKLKEQEDCSVDYCIGFPQPYKLLKNNPHIDNVYLSNVKGPRVQLPISIQESLYDVVYELPECRQDVQPTIWYQQYCGVKNPTSEYQIYTDVILDQSIAYELNLLNPKKVKVIGYVANWKNLTIKYTKEEYNNGLRNIQEIMSHSQSNTRNIEYILNELNKDFILIPLGYDHNITQYHTALDSTSTYTNTASIVKNCDLVIGQEGGLTNLAAGVGTKCIITTDFMHVLYGPRGVMRQFNEVKLGPKNMFPNSNHIHLDPFYSDDEIIKIIKNEI
jgi:ADP-heptose:LPS heptosyltransferase